MSLLLTYLNHYFLNYRNIMSIIKSKDKVGCSRWYNYDNTINHTYMKQITIKIKLLLLSLPDIIFLIIVLGQFIFMYYD